MDALKGLYVKKLRDRVKNCDYVTLRIELEKNGCILGLEDKEYICLGLLDHVYCEGERVNTDAFCKTMKLLYNRRFLKAGLLSEETWSLILQRYRRVKLIKDLVGM